MFKKIKNILGEIMDWLEKKSTLIVALATIIALIFSSISLYLVFHPLPNKSNLNVFGEDITNKGVTVFIHNGGQAPCINLIIRYPNKFQKVEQILNYKTSNLRNSEYKNDSFMFSPQYWIPLNLCEDSFCSNELGYLDINEIVPIHFTFNNPKIQEYRIRVSCSGQVKTLKFNFKPTLSP